MKKKCILLVVILFVALILGITGKSYAVDLDEIENYIVTVDPNEEDGTLYITYDITWRVLDSTQEGPLTWVRIGTANDYFDGLVGKTDNIKSITSSGSYVRVDFTDSYYAGEVVKFKYSLHQTHVYSVKNNQIVFEFTPAWFTDAKVDNMTIRWNSNNVKRSDDNMPRYGNYLVWNKTNMKKGAKLKATVKYNKNVFQYATEANSKKYAKRTKGYSSYSYLENQEVLQVIIIFAIIILAVWVDMSFGDGYYGHRGFYSGHRYGGYGVHYHSHYHHSSCAHSSCACAHSCACACAGSGRAGCSKKDFYGTNLTSKKIKKAMK